MVWLIKTGNTYNTVINYYEADEEVDKTNFDASNVEIGSKIHVIDNDKFYILNSSHEWKETSYGGML